MRAVLDITRRDGEASLPNQGSGGGDPPDRFDDHGGGGDDAGDRRPRDPRQWVTLASFWYPAHAHIARLRLESAGVACVLVGEIAAATHVLAIANGGVKLQVPRAHYALASRLLRQASMGRPEPRVAAADFERVMHAKAAACVVEAAGLWCDVVERRDAEAPAWSRLVPAALRARLWPAASLVVEREDLPAAVAALVATPFARGLTPAGSAVRPGRRCVSCEADSEWAVWQLSWPESAQAARPAPSLRMAVPRLVRRCGRCGSGWAAGG